MKIILDAFGGDNAPAAVLEGCALARSALAPQYKLELILTEHLRAAFLIGAAVQQQIPPLGVGDGGGDGRPFHPLDALGDEGGPHHHGPGAASGDKGVPLPGGQHLEALCHGAVLIFLEDFLCAYISQPATVDFQPMGSNMGILPPLEERERNKERGN